MTDQELSIQQKDTLRTALVNSARDLLGIPYEFGAEWKDFTKLPGTLDCSELVEGVFHYNGLKMPDGSQAQFDFTVPAGSALPGDLAFFGRGGKPSEVYHVGFVFDHYNILEARGFDPKAMFDTGKVILRSRQRWEDYANFLGYRKHVKL